MKTFRLKLLPLLLAVLATVSGQALHAQSAFLQPFFFSPQEGNFGTLGTAFSVNPGYELTVTHVGYWDEGNNGVTGGMPISVALFDNSTQTIIDGLQFDFTGSVGNVIVTDPVYGAGSYRFVQLSTPIVLDAGNYTIAEWNYGLGNGSDIIGNRGGGNSLGFTFNTGALTLIGTTGTPDSSNGTFPTVTNSNSADFFAGNFMGTASTVPEPSTAAMISLGLFAVCASARRRLRRVN